MILYNVLSIKYINIVITHTACLFVFYLHANNKKINRYIIMQTKDAEKSEIGIRDINNCVFF